MVQLRFGEHSFGNLTGACEATGRAVDYGKPRLHRTEQARRAAATKA